jgi:hypothetical protein
MIKSILILGVLTLSATPVMAQKLATANTDGAELQTVSTSLSTESLNTSGDYPVCHRMKNGIAKHSIQTATTE